MKISNSGKTITIRMPGGHVGDRFKVVYTPSNVVLLQKCGEGEGHLVHSTGCMTLNSKHFSNWPLHGQIEPKFWWETLANRYRVEIPEGPLPPVKVIIRKKKALMVPQDDGTLGLPEELKSHQVSPLADAIAHVANAGMEEMPESPAVEPREEAIICFKGRTYMFNVPTADVIDLVLEWGSRGFGVR